MLTKLGFAATWRATFDAVRADAGLYATLAAAFVVLPAMIASVFGPPEPRTLADLTGATMIAQGVLALVGAVAQLAIAGMAMGAAGSPRDALRRGLAVLPGLVVAALLTALTLFPGLTLVQAGQRGYPALLLPGLILLIPGVYAAARLALALPILAVRTANPVAALQASWAATKGNGWRVLGLLASAVGALLCIVLLAGGVAAAVGSVLTLIGGKTLAGFVVALISAAVASLYTVYSSVLLGIVARRLVG